MWIFLFLQLAPHAPILGSDSWNSASGSPKSLKAKKISAPRVQNWGDILKWKKIRIELFKKPWKFNYSIRWKLVKIRIFYITPKPTIDCVNPIDWSRYWYSSLGVVGVERGMSETMKQISSKLKSGDRGICNARKTRPAGLSRHLGCVFVKRCRKRRMARPEGPSPNLGPRGDDHRAEPKSPFLVASDQNSCPCRHRVFSREPIRHSVVDCLLSRQLSSKPYYHLLLRLYCAKLLENH